MTDPRFPPPWSVEDIGAAFVVKDSSGQKPGRAIICQAAHPRSRISAYSGCSCFRKVSASPSLSDRAVIRATRADESRRSANTCGLSATSSNPGGARVGSRRQHRFYTVPLTQEALRPGTVYADPYGTF